MKFYDDSKATESQPSLQRPGHRHIYRLCQTVHALCCCLTECSPVPGTSVWPGMPLPSRMALIVLPSSPGLSRLRLDGCSLTGGHSADVLRVTLRRVLCPALHYRLDIMSSMRMS
ncbi:hypothetical protein NN561_002508 [Cricetulus griseus]